MPARFSAADVAAIAALAHLELNPAEVELFARQLGDILAYAEEVQRVETSGVAPTAHLHASGGTDRADEVRPSLGRDAALANAPDAVADAADGFFFRVPRVIG